jgi:hypothetical protein
MLLVGLLRMPEAVAGLRQRWKTMMRFYQQDRTAVDALLQDC